MFSVTDVRKRLKLGEIVCDSLQLVDEINKIRKQETEKFNKKYKTLRHDNFLTKVREYNFVAKELGVLVVKESSYINSQNK